MTDREVNKIVNKVMNAEEWKRQEILENELEKYKSKVKTEADIEAILDDFDFEYVRSYMQLTHWSWRNAENEDGIPTIDELKSQARKLIEDVIYDKEEHRFISTGGFKVMKFGEFVELSFEIATSCNDF